MSINPLWAWVIVAIIFFIIEIVTPTTFLVFCFGIGALSAGISTIFGPPGWVPWLVFVFISLIAIILSRPLAQKLSGKKPVRQANVDALIGQKGKVTQTINSALNTGMVLVEREEWRADAQDNTIKIEEGEVVEIVKVEGTHLIVKKAEIS